MNPKDAMWSEKWRPKRVDDIVGDFRHKIKLYLEKEETIPHFLFHSSAAGTGKTSLCKALINELNCDALILNSSDDRKIETIREKVKEFAITQSSKKGKRRVIFLDEIDGMLKVSQDALRNIMETFSSNCIFLLTCNNLNKVIEPIQSRCVVVPFAYPNKQEIFNYLEKICKGENLKYTTDGLIKVIEIEYPSIRNMVLNLQDLHTQKLNVTIENVTPVNAIYNELWKYVLDKNWIKIKETVIINNLNVREINKHFWELAVKEGNIKLIQLTCRNEKDISWGADEMVIFVTSLIEMCK